MERQPDIQIVIPTRNNCDVLRRCLTSVRKHRGNMKAEVWVVDNASSDATLAMLMSEFPEVRIIASDVNLFFTPANKLAVSRSSSKYVLLLNDDTELLSPAIQEMFGFMEEHYEAGICGCRLRNADRSWRRTSYAAPTIGLLIAHFWGFSSLAQRNTDGRILRAIFHALGGNVASYMCNTPSGVSEEVDVVSGACLFFRRSVVEHVGEMDDNFRLGPDDWDWCLRIKQKGWKVYLLSSAVEVVHLGGVSTCQEKSSATLEFYRGWFYFYVKHYGVVGRCFLSILLPMALLVRMLVVLGVKFAKLCRIGELVEETSYHCRLCAIALREALLRPQPRGHETAR